MSVVKETKKCPFCKETIAVGAVICKHCHSELSKPKKSVWKKYNTFRMGFWVGVLFSLILFILIYEHFFTKG